MGVVPYIRKILWKWWQCPLAQVPTLGVVHEMQTMLHSGSTMTWNFMSLQYWLWSSGIDPIDVNEGRCFCCMLFVAAIALAFSSHTSSRTHLCLFPCKLHDKTMSSFGNKIRFIVELSYRAMNRILLLYVKVKVKVKVVSLGYKRESPEEELLRLIQSCYAYHGKWQLPYSQGHSQQNESKGVAEVKMVLWIV